ncbi:hypothetical protein E2C01_065165 [Portunus trituberculatus]|uniref:Uncharacterized protein n=1 Tax=Portunus trituberculatus TaxID=210409 RepID=A0A5B7HL55_PORTR|nr:hypothetical protein [Portunus trituberculatus]
MGVFISGGAWEGRAPLQDSNSDKHGKEHNLQQLLPLWQKKENTSQGNTTPARVTRVSLVCVEATSVYGMPGCFHFYFSLSCHGRSELCWMQEVVAG